MGANPYWYFVKYQPDIDKALFELREREFIAGRYNPATILPEFPILEDSPAPGAKHASISEVFAAAMEDGTRSILDIERISNEPDFGVAAPFDTNLLEFLYGTTAPTRKMLEENQDYFEEIERGHCFYTIVFKDGKPDEIFFAGYSFD
jgi:hypothetical protein